MGKICNVCPGGVRKVERTAMMQITSTSSLSYETMDELELVLYTSPNVAMSNVYSPTKPQANGRTLTGYGRRRGANSNELELYERGELNKEVAAQIKALGYSVFYVHADDIAARPDLFKVIKEAVQVEEATPDAQDIETVGVDIAEMQDDIAIEVALEEKTEESDLTLVSHVTKATAAALREAGYLTYEELANASAESIAEYFTATKKYTQVERAELAIYSAGMFV